LDALGGRFGGGRAERLAELELAVPAAKPVEALLLLVQLGKRELLRVELAVDLGLVLRTLADELGPLVLAPGCEERLEAQRLRLVAPAGVEEQGFPFAALDQADGPREPLVEP